MLNGYCCCFDCFRLAASDLPQKNVQADLCEISENFQNKFNNSITNSKENVLFDLHQHTLHSEHSEFISNIVYFGYSFTIRLYFFQFTVLYVSFCTHFMSIIAKKNMVPFSQPALNALDTFG